MNSKNEVIDRLKQINTENKIWVIYIGIIILSWYANSLEKNYFLYNDNVCKEKYRNITILIFSILIIVYIYFLYQSIKDIKDLNVYDSKEKKELVYLSFLGSLFIVISGFIFLYIAIVDEKLNIELAFN